MLREFKVLTNRMMLWWKLVIKPANDFRVSFFTRVKYAILGFSANEYEWYNFKKNDYHEYISNYERTLSREINGKYKIILDNKMIFEDVFTQYANIAHSYAWISNGEIYGRNHYLINNSNIMDFIREKRNVILKIEEGAGGRGVFLIENVNNKFLVNGIEKTNAFVMELIQKQKKAFLCEYIKQSQFEDSLYPFASNTIRIIVGKEKNGHLLRILGAVQRIGNELSKPVDNVSAGALAASIDIETGELGYAFAAKSHRRSDLLIKYDRHPDTNAQIKGKVIPDWENIKEHIIEITSRFPYLNLVGWDILLSDNGFYIIEGNASSGLIMFQTENGVRNTEIGNIYRSYGIIK